MEKLKQIIKKVCTKEVILYGIFGILTTMVNLVSFYVLTNLLHINENISNMLAILLAVLFAYFTNKDLVFHSQAQTIKERGIQFLKFMSGRAFTMAVEWVGCYFLFLTPLPQMLSKLSMTILVIILNFFISKFFVF